MHGKFSCFSQKSATLTRACEEAGGKGATAAATPPVAQHEATQARAQHWLPLHWPASINAAMNSLFFVLWTSMRMTFASRSLSLVGRFFV